jgi:hypothetical protein
MGAGASIEQERERIFSLFPDKPEDGSDIKVPAVRCMYVCVMSRC